MENLRRNHGLAGETRLSTRGNSAFLLLVLIFVTFASLTMSEKSPRRISRRACDQCRRRRGRCEGAASVCDHCTTNGWRCSWQLPVKKRGPKRKDASDVRAEESPAFAPQHSPQTTSPHPCDGDAAVRHDNGCNAEDVEAVWSAMINAVRGARGIQDVKQFFVECIDAYMHHLFPITPIIPENPLRSLIEELFERGRSWQSVSTPPGSEAIVSSRTAAILSNGHLPLERSISLVLALCANVCYLLPSHLFGSAERLQSELFSASRQVLRLYHERDIEQPSAVSVIVRYFHTACFHAAGQTRVSWLVLGEAIRLALEMHVYDESSLIALDPIERELRRALYWQLSTGDQSSSILNNRPLCFHRLNFEVPASTLSRRQPLLLDSARSCNGDDFEERLLEGFSLISRLFNAATDVFVGLKYITQITTLPSSTPERLRSFSNFVKDDLLRFHSILDDLPDYIEQPWRWTAHLHPADLSHQVDGFWIQHINLKLTYHVLKLVLIQKAAEWGLIDVLGLSGDVILLALQKTEIAIDVLGCLRGVPFDAIRLNGEPAVRTNLPN